MGFLLLKIIKFKSFVYSVQQFLPGKLIKNPSLLSSHSGHAARNFVDTLDHSLNKTSVPCVCAHMVVPQLDSLVNVLVYGQVKNAVLIQYMHNAQ